MSFPLLVRKMNASETNIVLAGWKNRLYEQRFRSRWGRGLEEDYFWLLVNHVIDKITVPSSDVLVGCAETEPGTPICWVVLRKITGLSTFDVLYVDARREILKDPKLAAALERELLAEVTKQRPLASERRTFIPFQELKR